MRGGKNKMHMDLLFKGSRRMMILPFPKRSSELVAVAAIVCTLFLFLHTQSLTTKLHEMENRLQPSALNSGNEYSAVSSADDVKQYPSRSNINPELENLYKYYKSTGQMNTLNPLTLNNTRHAENQIIFFNRVPKVGSQTFMELLRRLSIRNNFRFHRDAVQRVETIRLSGYQQEELAEMISELPTPSVYVKHVVYTNFTRFKLPTPIYVNLVRDPIERIISWFYYIRAPWYYVERKQAFPDLPLPDPHWLRKDFETCVLRGDPECTYTQGESHEGIGDHRRQSLFMCGHENECTLDLKCRIIIKCSNDCLQFSHYRPFNSKGALERAKNVVETQYSVVGVLEDLNTTLAVLEKYIPRFFAGASEIYFNEIKSFNKINKNNFKPPVSEEVKNIVRQNFSREIEFYKFCKQRLHTQYLATKLMDFK